MSGTSLLAVEIDPEIRSNERLYAAVQRATDYVQEGLGQIDAKSETQTAQPEIRWSFDEDDEQRGLKITYREKPADSRTGFQQVMRRVPISQILDGVGRRSWMIQILQGVNRRRYDEVINRFEQLIREREESEANGH